MEAWRHGFAAIDENSDFKFRPVGAGKALKIADDETFVNDREVAGLQRGHAVIVLIDCRKTQLDFGGIAAIGVFGPITRYAGADACAKQQK